MYRILFPHGPEPLPSPCAYTLSSQSGDVNTLTDYDDGIVGHSATLATFSEYSQRELPRIIRRNLEPIDPTLSSRIVEIVIAAHQTVLLEFQQPNQFAVEAEDRVGFDATLTEAPTDIVDDNLGQYETISNSESLDLAQLENNGRPNFEEGILSDSGYGTIEAAIPTDNFQGRTGERTEQVDTGDDRHNLDYSLFLNFDQFSD